MILHRYILRELVVTCLMVFLTLSLVIFIGFGVQQYRRLEGLGFGFLLETAPFLFCHALTFSLPTSALMASVLVFGRLAAENEIVAIRAAGIHLWRAVYPAAAFGLLLAGAFLLFNHYVAPVAVQRQRVLARTGLANTLASPPPLGTSLLIGDHRILYTRFRDDAFQELSILRVPDRAGRSRGAGAAAGVRPSHPPEVDIIWTRQSQFAPGDADRLPGFRLQDVTWLHVLPQKPPVDWPVSTAGEVWYPIDLGGLVQKPPRPFEMPTTDLIETLTMPGSRVNLATPSPDVNRRLAVLAEINKRWAWAAAPFVLTLFGAAVGILLRKGSRLAGFGASLSGGIPYFLIATLGQAFAEKANVPPLVSVWLADGLFFLIAAVLLWRVSRI